MLFQRLANRTKPATNYAGGKVFVSFDQKTNHRNFCYSSIIPTTTIMTTSKRSKAGKGAPKRAVSFCPTVKPEAPSRGKPNVDKALQSVNKKRRYMRRGSKCPSMLRASFSKITPLLKGCAADVHCTSDFSLLPNPAFHFQEKNFRNLSRAQRRLSVMTALKISLENTSIVDPVTPQPPQRMERRLSASFQFLSPV